MPIGDLIWGVIGFLLSILVFSYLIGDNVLFRLAIHLFIGVSAGVVAVMILYQVIYPRLLLPFISGTNVQKGITLIPFILSILLLFKVTPRGNKVGLLSSSLLLGIGVAVTIGGAILGTLFPQINATISPFGKGTTFNNLLEGLLILVATVTSLLYFYFGAKLEMGRPLKRPAWIEWSAKVGQIFILITLGAIFAGVYITSISALSERLISFWEFAGNLFR